MANPTTVGQNTPTVGGTSTTVSFTTNRIVLAGEKIWVYVGWFAANLLSSVSGGSLAWTVDSQQANGSDRFGFAWADVASDLPSGTTITATIAGTGGDTKHICGFAAAGWATGAASARNSGTTSTTTWTSGTVSVLSGDILVGGSYGEGSPSGATNNTATGGNTEVHDFAASGDSGVATEYQVGTGASIAIQGTWNTATTSANVAASFAQAVAGTPSIATKILPFPKAILNYGA